MDNRVSNSSIDTRNSGGIMGKQECGWGQARSHRYYQGLHWSNYNFWLL